MVREGRERRREEGRQTVRGKTKRSKGMLCYILKRNNSGQRGGREGGREAKMNREGRERGRKDSGQKCLR